MHIDTLLGKYKSEEFMHLIRKWNGNLTQKRVLKTDLREEAFGKDEILFSLPSKNSIFFALDIVEETVRAAYWRQKNKELLHKYVAADVRELPFTDNCFDILLSSSTLDHFTTEYDFIKSLTELRRVTKSGGKMIITINNRRNFNFYFLLKLEKLLKLKSYPVQTYSPPRLKRIVKDAGWRIANEDFIVHIISPINTLLIIMRSFMKDSFVDSIAKRFISFAKFLEKRKTKSFTGWFIALECIRL